jgi:hypothetical protein
MFEKIKKWYNQGLWTVKMVQDAEEKGIITSNQVIEILASK